MNFQPDIVVNCAALSVPRACEMDPAGAMSINVPSALVKWMSSFNNSNALLIHMSTDQGNLPRIHHIRIFYHALQKVLPLWLYYV